ncbi:MAG: hypothetical protein ACKV2T_13585 [Kofleriaceae bacterium]
MTIDALFGSRIAEVVPDAITPALADELRARVSSYTRYTLVDRGSYHHAAIDEPALFTRFVQIVETRLALAGGAAMGTAGSTGTGSMGAGSKSATNAMGTGVRSIVEARVLRFLPGDYLLAHADRVYDGNPIEIVLDISESSTPGAEVHYRRRGAVFFRVPSAPCSLAIVERGPTVTSNHTYVSKRYASDVLRLVALVR